MANRPLLTIAQVVDQFDLSRATVRRGIDSGRFEGAHKDAQGRWLVPVDALVVAGIKPRKTWLHGVAAKVASERTHEHAQDSRTAVDPLQINVAPELAHGEHDLAQSASRIAQLEAQLETEKRLREASERNADDLRSALRMIEASTPPVSVQEPRRRWWQRNS